MLICFCTRLLSWKKRDRERHVSDARRILIVMVTTILLPVTLCVICNEVLAHESMKPSKLMRHLQTKHPACKDEPVEFFQRRLHELKISQHCLTASCSEQEQVLWASYHIAHRIA